MDRATGSLLKTSGQVSALRTAKAAQAQAQSPTTASFPAEQGEGGKSEVEEYAALVWAWVNTSAGLVGDIDAEVGPPCTPLQTASDTGEKGGVAADDLVG